MRIPFYLPAEGRPFRDFFDIPNDIEDFFFNFPYYRETNRVFPNCNIYEEYDKLNIVFQLPGMEKDRIDIRLEGSHLILKGERKNPEEEFHRKERFSGNFERKMELPYPVDPESAKADYTDGVLTITLSNAKSEAPRKIALG